MSETRPPARSLRESPAPPHAGRRRGLWSGPAASGRASQPLPAARGQSRAGRGLGQELGLSGLCGSVAHGGCATSSVRPRQHGCRPRADPGPSEGWRLTGPLLARGAVSLSPVRQRPLEWRARRGPAPSSSASSPPGLFLPGGSGVGLACPPSGAAGVSAERPPPAAGLLPAQAAGRETRAQPLRRLVTVVWTGCGVTLLGPPGEAWRWSQLGPEWGGAGRRGSQGLPGGGGAGVAGPEGKGNRGSL